MGGGQTRSQASLQIVLLMIFMLTESNAKEAFNDKRKLKIHVQTIHRKSFECNDCEYKFDARWKLETHLKEHTTKKEYKCEQCGSEFYLKWRLNRHIKGHGEIDRKFCHFFNNEQNCPYEVNGCKVKHEAAGMCKLLMDCTTYLCQFTHKKDASENVDNASVDKVRIEPSIKSSKEEKNY